MEQYKLAIQCRSITPIVGITKSEIPQKSRPYPSIADTIAAFAPEYSLISGFSLRSKGIEVLINVNGPPYDSPHAIIRTTTSI